MKRKKRNMKFWEWYFKDWKLQAWFYASLIFIFILLNFYGDKFNYLRTTLMSQLLIFILVIILSLLYYRFILFPLKTGRSIHILGIKKGKKDCYSIKNEYKKSWNYLKESRNFIILGIVLFFVFALIGYFVPAPEIVSEQVQNLIQELIEKTKDMNQAELTTFILLNNVQVSFFAMLFGFLLGIAPIVSLIANGYLAGFVGRLATQEVGAGVLVNFIPHGVFELPAIFISMGLGIKLGTFLFQNNKSEVFRKYLFDSIRAFFYIVVPLLIIAAIIEAAFIFLV